MKIGLNEQDNRANAIQENGKKKIIDEYGNFNPRRWHDMQFSR
jgi:hypothetical protein